MLTAEAVEFEVDFGALPVITGIPGAIWSHLYRNVTRIYLRDRETPRCIENLAQSAMALLQLLRRNTRLQASIEPLLAAAGKQSLGRVIPLLNHPSMESSLIVLPRGAFIPFGSRTGAINQLLVLDGELMVNRSTPGTAGADAVTEHLCSGGVAVGLKQLLHHYSIQVTSPVAVFLSINCMPRQQTAAHRAWSLARLLRASLLGLLLLPSLTSAGADRLSPATDLARDYQRPLRFLPSPQPASAAQE